MMLCSEPVQVNLHIFTYKEDDGDNKKQSWLAMDIHAGRVFTMTGLRDFSFAKFHRAATTPEK